MKKLIYLIVVIIALALIIAGCTTFIVPPVEQNETSNLTKGIVAVPFTFAGGSLTADLGSWGGIGYVYPLTFDVTASPLDITFHDMDGSLLENDNGTTPWYEALKGVGMPGVTAGTSITNIDPVNNSVYWIMVNLNSSTDHDWNNNPVSTLGPDETCFTLDDTRHWGFQDWYRPATGGKISGIGEDPYYNAESYITPNDRFTTTSAHDASFYNTFDLRIKITHSGGNNYNYEMWVRMHNCASVVEECHYCDCGVWNYAINNCGTDDAWRQLADGMTTVFSMSDIDLSAVHPFVGLGNYPVTATHTLTWGDVVVIGTPTPQAEVWVDDDWTGYSYGDPVDGHTFGYDAFASIQDGVDAVADCGTVYVANGNYDATSSPFVRITKPLSLIGESRDGVILDGSGTSTIGWAKGIHVTANNVTIENLTVQNFGAVGYCGYGIVFRDYAHDTSGEGFIYYDSCMVENVCSQNNCYPMYAFCYTNLTICNCLIQDNLSDGMFIAKGSNNAVITGNTVLNSGDHGIWVGGAGWCGPSCNNATITDNYIDGAREGGISFVSSDGATISGNTITNAAGEGWSVGALSLKDGPSNVEAYNNMIYNNNGSWGGYSGTGHGIGIDGTPSNIYLHHNSIYGNAGYGIHNYSGITIDATCNWWGDFFGPSGEGPGSGDAVSTNVDFQPWLLNSAPESVCGIGIKLDIKPQSCPNPLNVKSKGVLPVAILGTAYFDVTQVDPSTIMLEGVPLLRWAIKDVATPSEFEECTTDGSDGFLDLTLKFDVQKIITALGEVSDGDVKVLTLTGDLIDGTAIMGEDVVLILKKGKK